MCMRAAVLHGKAPMYQCFTSLAANTLSYNTNLRNVRHVQQRHSFSTHSSPVSRELHWKVEKMLDDTPG